LIGVTGQEGAGSNVQDPHHMGLYTSADKTAEIQP
jgi:hypothetical protein